MPALPAVFCATLQVIPTAGSNRFQTVPAPQEGPFGSLDQAIPVIRNRQCADLGRQVIFKTLKSML